ncbi:MAG: YidC/Oxa1 family membrane protein insertase [Patescibacteria group bacterium]
MASFFHTAVYQPIYNALAFIIGIVPGGDIGVAIIVITILVRFVLFPLSLTAIKTQISMRAIEPQLKALRDELKDNKEELARRTMALFKENNINPFASFLLILIQLPIIIGLYLVLQSETKVVSFDPSVLYSFVHAPEQASLLFLGLMDLTGKSILLALLVAVTQFIYARLMTPVAPPKNTSGKPASFQDDLARSMHLQMRYVFPAVIGFVAYAASSAIALYFLVGNLFSIGQEILIRRMHHGKR